MIVATAEERRDWALRQAEEATAAAAQLRGVAARMEAESAQMHRDNRELRARLEAV
eukprot:SAG11_NODE_16347_length_550_cov_0.791574_1_plen_55_part_10